MMQGRAMRISSSSRRKRRREKRKRESPCREGGGVLTRAMSRRREKERDWTLLPEGIVDCIGGLLLEEDVIEYIRLRGVCASWRYATLDPVLTDPRFHPFNWILISQLENHNEYFRFLNLSTGKYIRARVPHDTARQTFLRVVDGLLVFLDEASLVIHLLNPFTGARISLPPLHELVLRKDHTDPIHLRVESSIVKSLLGAVKFALPSSSFTVVLHFISTLAYAKPGDREWSFTPVISYYFIQSFQHQLYSACHIDGHLLRLDQTGLTTLHASLFQKLNLRISTCLVVSDGEILAVRNYQYFLKVFKVDVENGKLIPKNSIGNRALFVALTSNSFSVSTRTFPSIIPGTVYYNTSRTTSVYYPPIGGEHHHRDAGPSCWHLVWDYIPPSHIVASQLNLYCKT